MTKPQGEKPQDNQPKPKWGRGGTVKIEIIPKNWQVTNTYSIDDEDNYKPGQKHWQGGIVMRVNKRPLDGKKVNVLETGETGNSDDHRTKLTKDHRKWGFGEKRKMLAPFEVDGTLSTDGTGKDSADAPYLHYFYEPNNITANPAYVTLSGCHGDQEYRVKIDFIKRNPQTKEYYLYSEKQLVAKVNETEWAKADANLWLKKHPEFLQKGLEHWHAEDQKMNKEYYQKNPFQHQAFNKWQEQEVKEDVQKAYRESLKKYNEGLKTASNLAFTYNPYTHSQIQFEINLKAPLIKAQIEPPTVIAQAVNPPAATEKQPEKDLLITAQSTNEKIVAVDSAQPTGNSVQLPKIIANLKAGNATYIIQDGKLTNDGQRPYGSNGELPSNADVLGLSQKLGEPIMVANMKDFIELARQRGYGLLDANNNTIPYSVFQHYLSLGVSNVNETPVEPNIRKINPAQDSRDMNKNIPGRN